jgi:hypothetical protein
MRKQRLPTLLQFRNAGELFARLGGGNHGTSQQRLDAAEAGFRVAYVENRSSNDAVRVGLDYIGFSLLR